MFLIYMKIIFFNSVTLSNCFFYIITNILYIKINTKTKYTIT